MAMDIVKRLREGRTNDTDLRWEVTAEHREAADEIERLRAEREDWKKVADDLSVFCDLKDKEIERLRAALADAVEILDGDGEYPATAQRFRMALSERK